MDLYISQQADSAVVTIAGSVGIVESDTLKGELEELIEQGARHLVLDIARMEFINSSGLGALIFAQNHLRKTSGGDLRLVNPRAEVLSVLETTRLTAVFSIYPSVDEALSTE